MSAPEQFDSPLRWWVDSDSRSQVRHLVDLELYGGNGACRCENFAYRLEPMLKEGAKPSDKYRCKHIKAARSALADLLVMKKSQEAKTRSKKK